jgi:CHAT domain/Lecithin:cholesterol acyltransferase/Ternary complex associated domain 7
MPRYKMPDIIVLLPGITGSVLKKNGKVVWGFSASTIAKALFTFGGSMEQAMALPHDDPALDDLGDGIIADALMPDLHLLPGIWKIDGYGKLAELIKANFEVTEGKNFFPFPYDWRRDNRVSARKLARAAHSWLSTWRHSTGNADAKLILIGHSMGGIVSRYFLECLEGWKVTKALVTFGTPYRGSLNALDGLANGLKKGPLELSTLARQLTALYQLLPIYECYNGGNGKLVRVGETTGIPNVDPAKAAAALAFHSEMEAAVASNQQLPKYQSAGYSIYPVVGVAQQTNLSARLAGDRVEMLQTYKGEALGGDGTVPRVSAIPIELSDNPASATYAGTQHGSLQNADSVITHLTGLLSGFDLDLGAFKKPKAQAALEVEDVFFAGEPVAVRALPSKDDVKLIATLWRSGESQPMAAAEMLPASGDWLAAEFPPPVAGAYRVTVSGEDVETAEDSLVVTDVGSEPMSPKRARAAGDAATQVPAQPFGGPIIWDRNSAVLELAAGRSFRSALRRIREEDVAWVVVVRPGSDDVYYYAFRSSELERLAAEHPERNDWSIELALDMHEWMSSRNARGGRPLGPGVGHSGPASARIVEFDAAGRIAAVGERADLVPPAGIDLGGDWTDLGPVRGGPGGGGLSRGTEIEVTLSAQTESEIDVGAIARVPFQVELTSQAMPLAVSQPAIAKADKPIVVSLSVENDAVEIVHGQDTTLDPPAPGQPRTGFFTVKGFRPGLARLAVAFRQGGTELGVIGLAIEVVQAGAQPKRAQGRAAAAPRDVADDDKLLLTIRHTHEGGQVFYDYFLHSEQLCLIHRLRSMPLLDRGGGLAATELAFVERIYERVTKELKSRDDLQQLQREARALGANLCQELFDPDVVKVLWPLRDRIKVIQIVSWEPYIPWELVRLRDPVSGDIDERFLAEYGLVRTMSDDMPPRSLPMVHWFYLGAKFPMGTFPPVGAELDYFTKPSRESLHEHSITPEAIAATRDAFYDALAEGDFDVLHISCHAESTHQSIERASLIIGDETPPGDGRTRLVEVDTITVQAEARLKPRRPLVFLNGCETGRVGAVLTAWGGWPKVFLRAGAGAFVGSAWAVRDKPAAAFSTAFYNALLGGKTLAEAAAAARAAAKKLGDASWLAFKVYGHPLARRGGESTASAAGRELRQQKERRGYRI